MQNELYRSFVLPYMTNGVMDFYQFVEFLDTFDLFDKIRIIYEELQEIKLQEYSCTGCLRRFRCLTRFNDV